jgi:hypothetical protein
MSAIFMAMTTGCSLCLWSADGAVIHFSLEMDIIQVPQRFWTVPW